MANWENYDDRIRQMKLKIKYYRNMRSLTQKKLAEKVHVTEQHISRIESPNNKYCTKIDTLFAIADALDVEVVKLLERED